MGVKPWTQFSPNTKILLSRAHREQRHFENALKGLKGSLIDASGTEQGHSIAFGIEAMAAGMREDSLRPLLLGIAFQCCPVADMACLSGILITSSPTDAANLARMVD